MPKSPKKVAETTYTRPPCYYLGIDPGASGGLAVLDVCGNVRELVSMPETEQDILQFVLNTMDEGLPVRCIIEQVQGSFGKGGRSPGAGMFKFGHNYGSLRMACLAAKVPFETAVPQRWQRALGIPPRKKSGKEFVETPDQYKQRLKAHAQQLFPGDHITKATADALLIALYCKRLHEGSLRC